MLNNGEDADCEEVEEDEGVKGEEKEGVKVEDKERVKGMEKMAEEETASSSNLSFDEASGKCIQYLSDENTTQWKY